MADIITTDDLVSQVRSMLDESNTVSITDDNDILPALNRAQDYATNILARHYESPLLTHITVNMVAGQKEYYLPEDALEQRLEKLEVSANQVFYPISRINYRDLSLYETSGGTSVPFYYVVVGNRYRLLPHSTGAYPLRMWYLKSPLPLVKQQGRITNVNTAGNYLIVDSVGDDLTTETDNLNSYINVIDAQTGQRKGTYQIKTINGNKIDLKIAPSRATVQNLTIDNSLDPLLMSVNTNVDNSSGNIQIEPDDYICVIKGTAVPFFKKPFSNFLVQYAVGELRRKLGDNTDMDQRVIDALERQVERSWVGREQSLRVTKKNANWNLPVRSYYNTRG